jgi:hypothetical protein
MATSCYRIGKGLSCSGPSGGTDNHGGDKAI